jgi:anti-sigma B factor antagonist
MDISIREYRQADVITIRGRVDSFSAEQLSQAIAGAHQNGKYNLVLDMSQVEFLSSAGLRALVEAQRHTTALGLGEITLSGSLRVSCMGCPLRRLPSLKGRDRNA